MKVNRSTEVSFPWSGPSLRRQICSVSPRTWLLPCTPPTEQLARIWLGGAGFLHALSHCSLSSDPPLPRDWYLASIPAQKAGGSPFCNLF